jgi:hypothetical protein
MKGLLFLLGVGAAIYTLLVYTHDVLPGGKAEDTFAGQTQSNHPVAQHLSSWGTHLPSRSLSQNQQQSAPLPPQQNAAYEPRSYDPSQNSERKPGAWYQFAASEAKARNSGSDGAAPVVLDPNSTQAALKSTTERGSAKAASPKSKKWSRSSKRHKPVGRASNTRSAKAALRVSRWDPWNIQWPPRRR